MNSDCKTEIKQGNKSQDSYEVLLQNPMWISKRESIKKRDNNKCKNCGSTSLLQVHHKQYHIISKTGIFRRPWEYNEKYLITLCSRCHHIGHIKFKVPVFNIEP
jgi:DNA-directed RNA polymerase subunit RPC12/RpoP